MSKILTAFASCSVLGVKGSFARACAATAFRPRHTQVTVTSTGTGLAVFDH